MYAQADRVEAQALLRRRWMVAVFPCAAVILAGIAIFVVCQQNRQDWGWFVACATTILGGGCFLFLYGVYVRPVRLYVKHIGYMLAGRKRETLGVLTDMSEVPIDKDGLDWYAMTVNVGEKDAREDDRLLYYDALKGKPEISLGTRVKILSNDKMISDIVTVQE